MHAVGKIFPRGDRSPAIVPHATPALHRAIRREAKLASWHLGRDQRIASGFYISHAQELTHA